jgi:CHAT domain-containing protein
MYQYDSLDINFLREEVLDEQTALLSYFFTGDGLALFILRQKSMDYHHLNWQGHNSQQLDSLLKALSRIEAGAAYQGRKAASRLYDALFAPALPLLEDISSLIIIPHLSLNQLPFEVLTSGPGDYLLRDYVIGYQFAATFLQDQAGKEGEPDRWLAVAPFASAGSWGNFSDLRSLPSSGEEIAGLNARQLLNREATKSVFLQEAERASLIHLATHAVANSAEPLRSYIAFYPENEEESGYRLYAHELYNLSLRGSGLAFLSACETSGGSLQGSEGIMSLSRAFAYAGCPALITSLWRAEDHATAYLSRRFYQHVEEGRHFPEALRLAKLDLLDDPAMAQFRTPAYWAHLVFIGRGDTEAEKGWPWWGLPLSGLMLIVVLMIWLRPWRINAGAR